MEKSHLITHDTSACPVGVEIIQCADSSVATIVHAVLASAKEDPAVFVFAFPNSTVTLEGAPHSLARVRTMERIDVTGLLPRHKRDSGTTVLVEERTGRHYLLTYSTGHEVQISAAHAAQDVVRIEAEMTVELAGAQRRVESVRIINIQTVHPCEARRELLRRVYSDDDSIDLS